MAYKPRFNVTAEILRRLSAIDVLHTRIQDAAIRLPTLPMMQKEVVARLAHGSSAIEGNPLTLAETRTALEGKDIPTATRRSLQEVRNAAEVIKFIQGHGEARRIKESDVFKIHTLLGANDALERGPMGAYRNYGVQVGGHIAPHFTEIPLYMTTLLEWVNAKGNEWPAVVSSAVFHFRFEYIHPFGDGNGRTGRALASWELYRRKFDSQHLFAVDETLWHNRQRYYAALHEAEKSPSQDLTSWITFMAEMIEATLEETWKRVQGLSTVEGREKIHLTPRQEKLLKLLRGGPMRPSDLQTELELTKGGLHFLLKPLMDAGLVQREGGYKTGVYRIPDKKV
jgi:Fic family protein